jgi:uncharacterized membrane protein
MTNKNYLFAGILFFLLSTVIISITKTTPLLFPTQETDLRKGADYAHLYSGDLFVQDIILKKDYIHGVSIVVGNYERINANQNVILLADTNSRILWSQRFHSSYIHKADFYNFNFGKSIYAGKGSKLYLCIYSINGNQDNDLFLARKNPSNMSGLQIKHMGDADAATTLKGPGTAYEGSLGVKTFESDSDYAFQVKLLLIAICLLITVLIISFPVIRPRIVRLNIVPEMAFLALAFPIGFVFAFMTPPFQVPDEPVHFYRSYQVSELNLLKYQETIPASLKEFASVFDRMPFRPLEKTTKYEIRSASPANLEPHTRTQEVTTDYVLPFIPQAFGIAIGRLFHFSPFGLLYMARIMNLLVAIFLIFLSIRTTPVMKWVIYLLGIMPMTCFLLGSISYDAVTIGLSFLLFSVIMKLAFGGDEKIERRDLYLLFLLSFVIGLCKPPYFLIVLLFLVIPVKKFAAKKNYFLLFFGLIFSCILATQVWQVSRNIFKPAATAMAGNFQASHPATMQVATTGLMRDTTGTSKITPIKHPYKVNAPRQREYILRNLSTYTGILGITLATASDFYLESFVGSIGWIDKPYPHLLSGLYLLLLVITAITGSFPQPVISWKNKMLALLILFMGVIGIETAMYISSCSVGDPIINGVQGRYFIPLAPLFFMLLLNTVTGRTLSFIPAPKKKAPQKGSRMKSEKPTVKLVPGDQVFLKSLPLAIIFISILVNLLTLYFLISRFYIFQGL